MRVPKTNSGRTVSIDWLQEVYHKKFWKWILPRRILRVMLALSYRWSGAPLELVFPRFCGGEQVPHREPRDLACASLHQVGLVVPSIDQTSLTPSSHQQSSSAWPLKISILSPPSLTSNSPNLPAPLIKYNHECICSDLSSPDSFNKCHVKNLILSDIASQKSVECIADVYFIIITFFIG